MKDLIEAFLLYFRHERGRSEFTIKTYAARLNQFVAWAVQRGLADWPNITRDVLGEFLQAEQQRTSAENTHGHIAALKAFYRFAEEEAGLVNAAEQLSLPRTWKRIPKALSLAEIEQLLTPVSPETPSTLCDQAALELAYSSGLRLSELCQLRIENLHLPASMVRVLGKGNKERLVPFGAN